MRQRSCFTPLRAEELALIESLKRDELRQPAGHMLLQEGAARSGLYTLLDGWALRFKTLPDGRRQVLQVLLPGDFIGLQQRLDASAEHGVQALTPVRLCAFERDAVWALHREMPSLGYDLTWLVARSHSEVDDNLLTAGQRSASERLAALVITLCERMRAIDPRSVSAPEGMLWPLSQRLMAEAVGLSLVHTHRSLRQLTAQGLLQFPSPQRLRVPNRAALAHAANLHWPLKMPAKPLI